MSTPRVTCEKEDVTQCYNVHDGKIESHCPKPLGLATHIKRIQRGVG